MHLTINYIQCSTFNKDYFQINRVELSTLHQNMFNKYIYTIKFCQQRSKLKRSIEINGKMSIYWLVPISILIVITHFRKPYFWPIIVSQDSSKTNTNLNYSKNLLFAIGWRLTIIRGKTTAAENWKVFVSSNKLHTETSYILK